MLSKKHIFSVNWGGGVPNWIRTLGVVEVWGIYMWSKIPYFYECLDLSFKIPCWTWFFTRRFSVLHVGSFSHSAAGDSEDSEASGSPIGSRLCTWFISIWLALSAPARWLLPVCQTSLNWAWQLEYQLGSVASVCAFVSFLFSSKWQVITFSRFSY